MKFLLNLKSQDKVTIKCLNFYSIKIRIFFFWCRFKPGCSFPCILSKSIQASTEIVRNSRNFRVLCGTMTRGWILGWRRIHFVLNHWMWNKKDQTNNKFCPWLDLFLTSDEQKLEMFNPELFVEDERFRREVRNKELLYDLHKHAGKTEEETLVWVESASTSDAAAVQPNTQRLPLFFSLSSSAWGQAAGRGPGASHAWKSKQAGVFDGQEIRAEDTFYVTALRSRRCRPRCLVVLCS